MSVLIEIDFDEARRKKYERGIAEHRANSSLPFDGDPVEEAYDECLDLANYVDEIERKGIHVPGFIRMMILAIAGWLKGQYQTQKAA